MNRYELKFPHGHSDDIHDDVNRFADSVDAYTVNDLQNMEKTRQRSQILSLLARSAMIAVCIGVLGYSAYMIGNKLVEDRLAESEYEELRVNESDYVTVEHSKNLQEPNAMPTVLQMLDADGEYEDYLNNPEDIVEPDRAQHYASYYRNFLSKAAQYEDMIGWIYMSDTWIDYPLMKGENNSYYLEHNYKGEESRSGSIYADCNVNDNYYSNYNMVIYGHNMKDGSMFHSLKSWCNDAKIKTLIQTSQIEIYTKEGIYIYDILAYYIDDSNEFARIAFTSESDYLNFLNTISRRSNIRTNKEYTADTRICTLITCTNGSNGDSRYVVHGILNQFIPKENL